MKIATRTVIAALSMLIISVAASSQVVSSKKDRRVRTINASCEAPNLSLLTTSTIIRLPCTEGGPSYCTPTPNQQARLTANVSNAGANSLSYKYTTSGGRIIGSGPNVTWDFSDAQPGTYTATVEVDNECGCVAFASAPVVVDRCPACPRIPCPNIRVSCPDTLQTPITFTAVLESGGSIQPVYNWSVSSGTIISGQGTPSIAVDTKGNDVQNITGTVTVEGVPNECGKTASCSIVVDRFPLPHKFDEFPGIRFNDEKARLDNFAIELKNSPSAQGYIIVYGASSGPVQLAQSRANRAREYLVNYRAVDARRIITVDGGCRAATDIELWIVPAGASPPTPDRSLAVPCGSGPAIPARGGGRRRGRVR